MTYGAIALFVLCPLTFLAGVFAPRALGFLDPLVCPEGYQLGNQSSDYVDPEGGTGVAVDIVCTGAGGTVDATPRMLMILFSLPILGFLLYVAAGKFKEAAS
ncbi:MAG: hypothetical protein ACRDFQ_07610 [Anaerolineales bacterium]